MKTSVRRVLSSVVREVDLSSFASLAPGDRLLRYEIVGTGFLRHMVRTIVGTLIEFGWRDKRAADMRAVIAARDRSHASATAPPHGLTLWKVEY